MGWNYLSITESQRYRFTPLECISDFIPHFTRHVITYPCRDQSYPCQQVLELMQMHPKERPRRVILTEIWFNAINVGY